MALVLALVVAAAVRRRLAVIVRQASAAQAETGQTSLRLLLGPRQFAPVAAAVMVRLQAARQAQAAQVQAAVQQVETQQQTQAQAVAAV